MTESDLGMMYQSLKIFGQLLYSAFLKFFCLEVEGSQNVFIREPGEDVASVIFQKRVIEELKVIEASANRCLPTFSPLLLGHYPVQLVAHDVAIFYELRVLYVDLPVLLKLIVIFEAPLSSLVFIHEIKQVAGLKGH